MVRYEATNNFLFPDSTLVAEIIAFFLMLWFIWKYVWPPVSRAMEQRQELIRTQLEESRQAKDRLERAEQEYREALREARAEAARAREEARAEGQRIVEEMRQRAQEEAARITDANEKALAAERGRVLAELRAEVGRLAVELAGRVIGESLQDDERQRRVVDRFLDEMSEQQREETERAEATAGSGDGR